MPMTRNRPGVPSYGGHPFPVTLDGSIKVCDTLDGERRPTLKTAENTTNTAFTQTIEVRAWMLWVVEARFKRLAKRAAKLGIAAPTFKVDSTRENRWRDENGRPQVDVYATLTITGDPVTFDVIIDFSAEGGTLGGGFDVVFDPAALAFVGLTSTDPADTTFDPAFGRDPDFLSGLLQSWAVGNFNGITGPALVGSVQFQVLPTMGAATIVAVTPTMGIAGPWVSATDFVTILNPDYNQVEVRKLGVCGDSEPDLGEQCDDGNTTPGDGCSAVCLVEAGFICTDAIASIPGIPPIPPVPSVCNIELPEVEICTLVTLNPDMVSDFSDADAIVGDGCDAFSQGIPVGVVGAVDGTYRLKVTNTGGETLVNVRINAADFGLVNEPIPAACGDLDPGEMCIINFADPGYPSLEMLDVCTALGPVNKIASVDGEGMFTGIPVSDDDPASVDCVVERSQVSGPY
jgi:cysteine-rich repeat protein